MTNYAGALSASISSFNQDGDRPYPAGWINRDAPVIWTQEYGRTAYGAVVGGTHAAGTYSSLPPTDFAGVIPPVPQDDFFENIFLLPRTVDVGLVLSTKNFTLQLYSSYRHETRLLTSFLNTAGAGVVLPGLPAIPASRPPQSGWTLQLQVLTSGPPDIDGDIIFGFDVGSVSLHLSGQRTILLPFEPEAPIDELLQFLTDIFQGQDGREQRHSLRMAPRQVYDVTYLLSGYERQEMEAMLLSTQDKALGFPLWHEAMLLTTAVGPLDLTIQVDDTRYADVRDNGLACVYLDETHYETLEVESHTNTSITFKSAITGAFPVAARVMPVRIAYTETSLRGQRAPVGQQTMRLRLLVLDNTVDLSAVGGFSTYNSKVLFDDANAIDTSLSESLERKLYVYDGDTGVFSVSSPWAVSRRGSAKRFKTSSRAGVWAVRQVLHALRGRAISFYLPTFYDDLTPTRNIAAGSTVLTVSNIGYTRFVQSRQPRNVIRITLTNGTVVIRPVASSAEIDEVEEQITVVGVFGVNATPADVERIDFVEKVRLDSDEAHIVHSNALGWATIEMPVKAVLE